MPFWYFTAISPAWGLNPDPAAWHMSAWQWMNIYGERPVIDTLSAYVFDNLFGRFPNLRVLVAEHGASWVPHTLSHLDKSRGMGRNGPWIGGRLRERPSEIFKEFIRVTPYPEDDIPRIVDQLDGDDRCLVMGSDFPHAEGLAQPSDFERLLQPLSADSRYRIMRGNADVLFQR
jgi:predicted TIM-barrel fold metal-dependent hydrolase